VTTLNAYRPSAQPHPIKHDDFTDAVIHEFGRVYAGKNKPMQTVEIDEGRVREDKVWDGVKELKSWEWTFGQTPEFSNDFEGDLSFGKVVSQVNPSSDCTTVTSSLQATSIRQERRLASSLSCLKRALGSAADGIPLQSVSLTSRHALLTSITFHLSPSFAFSTADTQTHQSFLDALALSLVGRRYETLDGAESPEGEWEEDPKWMEMAAETIAWLRHTM
jgi:lipoate-protein ligase A